jgi:hypothetical protein
MEHQAGLVPNRTGEESRQIVVRFGDTVTTKGTTPINSFGVKSCVIQETARAVKLGFYAPARGRAAVKATASGSEQSTIKVMSQRIARSAAWRIGLPGTLPLGRDPSPHFSHYLLDEARICEAIC